MNLKKIGGTAALTLFFTLASPNFTAVENLLKGEERPKASLVSRASASQKKLEETIKFEVNNKQYSIKEEKDKFLVYDGSGMFVEDEDIAQKVISSKLIYSNLMAKFEKLPPKPWYTAYFKAGELIQYAKNTLGLILFGSHKIVTAAVKGAKYGPKGALVGALGELTKEQIIAVGKKAIQHPEAISREIAIQSYKEGYRAWENNVSVEIRTKETGVLHYEDAESFLYHYFKWNDLMKASNELTTDIVHTKYDVGADATLANTVFALLGRNIDSFKKGDIIEEVNKALNVSLGQYKPYRKFSEKIRKSIEGYIKTKLDFNETAASLIGKPEIIDEEKKPELEMENGLIAFSYSKSGNEDIYVIDPNTKIIKNLTKHPSDDNYPSWSPNGERIIFTSDRSGSTEIYSMNKKGSDISRLTHNRLEKYLPRWSPKEDFILFTGSKPGRKFMLYKLNLKTSKIIRLGEERKFSDFFSSFSLSGGKFSFTRERGNKYEILICNLTKKMVESRLKLSSRGHSQLSPDGNEMLVYSSQNVFLYDITQKDPVKIGEVDLSLGFGFKNPTYIDWSPDGKKYVVVARSADGSGHKFFYIIRGGSDLEILANMSVDSPSWQPIYKKAKPTQKEEDTNKLYSIDNVPMVLIPAGRFKMGRGNRGSYFEWPERIFHLNSFFIDTYEVTNEQYKKFVNSTGYPKPLYWDNPRFNGPDKPVVGVSSIDAKAYCEWINKRLPTEAEWEKAARGTKGRRHPWGGEKLDSTKLNERYDSYEYTAPVGSFPDGVSPYGVFDMAGNVGEFVQRVHPDNYFSGDLKQCRKKESNKTLKFPNLANVRGGSFKDYTISTIIEWINVHHKSTDTGFRCAKCANDPK